MKIKVFFPHIWVLTLFSILCLACNEKSDEPSAEAYTPTPSVAVNSFSLQANTDIMPKLDSVYFSIDLDHAVIFNADSLPVGTDITKLVANISFPNTVTDATLEMTGGSVRQEIIDYKANSLDSIDFSGKVLLRLSAGEDLSRTYTIKVNVHKTNPDTIVWDKMASTSLPSRLKNPRSQKTVDHNGTVISLIEENDGSFSLASTPNPASGVFSITPLSLSFTPQVRSLTSCNSRLYLLSDNGHLYASGNSSDWEAVAPTEKWDCIIGAYGNELVGLSLINGEYHHCYLSTEYGTFRNGEAVESGFPVKDLSNFAIFASKWSDESTGLLAGGIDVEGNCVDQTWAYDGSSWTTISNISLPPLAGVTLAPYYIYRKTTSSLKLSEFSVWLAFGGVNPDGTLNSNVYLSYDTGVNWIKAPQYMQFPDFIPAFSQADAVVVKYNKSYDLSNAWKARRAPKPSIARVAWEVDDNKVMWECPYIFLFGGLNSNNQLNDLIWRGVLARLSYPPLF